MSVAFQINPREVLGVADDATLAELHEAYRARARKYHPDTGGDEWAFRILNRAYEMLSAARVAGRAEEEMRRDQARRADRTMATPDLNPFARVQPARPGGQEDRARVGVRDPLSDPARLVAVEYLLLRFELTDPSSILLGRPQDRNLSCSLHIAWPLTEASAPGREATARTLHAVQAAFEIARKAVVPLAAEARVESDRFLGLLSYPSAHDADAAFRAFRSALTEHGLGVSQTIRDLTIPRTWHD